MPDELNVAVGADAGGAVTAFDQLGESVDQFNVRMGSLNSSFAAPLEHVGVRIFGGELLRTIGLGGEMRPVLSLMNVGVREVADSMGIAAGAAGIYTFGLTALAAIAYKVYEATKSNSDEAVRSVTETQNQIKAFGDLTAAGGKLTAAMSAVAKAEQDDANQKLKGLLATAQAKLDEDEHTLALQKNGLAYFQRADARNHDGVGLAHYEAAIKATTKAIDADKLSVEALSHGYATVDAYVKGATKSADDNTKAVESNSAIMEASRQRAVASIKKEEAAQAAANVRAVEYGIDQEKAFEKADAAARKFFGLHKTGMEDVKSLSASTANSMASSFGNATSKMLVDNQNFSQATQGLLKGVAEQAVSEFATMGAKWAALKVYQTVTDAEAQTTITTQQATAEATRAATAKTANMSAILGYEAVAEAGAAASAAWGTPAASAAAVAAEEAIFAPIIAQGSIGAATGADFLADTPTRLLVGEAGEPEHVTVTPMSQSGGTSGGKGGDTYFTFGDIVIKGIDSPRQFADQVALLVTQAIRGRGQLSLVGPSIH